jgi:hypothetical protein
MEFAWSERDGSHQGSYDDTDLKSQEMSRRILKPHSSDDVFNSIQWYNN